VVFLRLNGRRGCFPPPRIAVLGGRPTVHPPPPQPANFVINGIGLIALRNPNYAVYVAGNSVSLIGTWMQRIGVGWLTWELTQSHAWLGLVAFADLFPSVFFGPIGGAIADRFDRLRIILTSQILSWSTVSSASTSRRASPSSPAWSPGRTRDGRDQLDRLQPRPLRRPALAAPLVSGERRSSAPTR
jgi:hypothetical protein